MSHRSGIRAAAPFALLAGLLVAHTVSLTLGSGREGIDYQLDAGPPIEALASGDFDLFFAEQPLMGLLSLLVRAPIVAIVDSLGSGRALQYQWGALACVLAQVALALWVAVLMRRRGQSLLACAVVAWLVAIGPVTDEVVDWGHPEESLGSALAAGAVVAALVGRSILAAVILGLALATKQWAVLAVLPVLAAAADRHLEILVIAGAIAVVLTLPFAVGDYDAFRERGRDAAAGTFDGTTAAASMQSIWWAPLIETTNVRVFDGVAYRTFPRYKAPEWLRRWSRPLIVVLGVVLGLAFLRWRRDWSGEEALALLALVFLLRCVLDPYNLHYYHAPFYVALPVWEGLNRRGLPVVSMLAAMAAFLIWEHVVEVERGAATNAIYLVWALPLVGYLALVAFGPRRLSDRLRGPLLATERPRSLARATST